MRQPNRIPPADASILMRCRRLGELIDTARVNLAMARRLSQETHRALSEHGLSVHQERMQRLEERLAELEAEHAPLREQAAAASERIENVRLRRFCEVYCIDGAAMSDIPELAGIHQRTAARNRTLLRKESGAFEKGIL